MIIAIFNFFFINECVTNEPHGTSAGKLIFIKILSGILCRGERSTNMQRVQIIDRSPRSTSLPRRRFQGSREEIRAPLKTPAREASVAHNENRQCIDRERVRASETREKSRASVLSCPHRDFQASALQAN